MQYSSLWGLFFLMTAAPMFMRDVLGFSLATTGFLGSLPYLVRWLSSLLFAFIADYIRSFNLLSVMNNRRIFAVICKYIRYIFWRSSIKSNWFIFPLAHIIPGLFLIGLPYVSFEPYLCVAFISFAMGFNGAQAQSTFSNFHDLTPNFATSIMTLINGIGITSGFVSPLVVTFFTSERVCNQNPYQ